ncbi:MAG: hypothetical protein H0W08_21565 [Acidobacteria bacterium]|nr:hypothetical protein [Acidobacteriota bacterium]
MAKKTNPAPAADNPRRIGGARPSYKRATYYLTADLIKRLKLRAIEDGTDASATVRSALEAFLAGDRLPARLQADIAAAEARLADLKAHRAPKEQLARVRQELDALHRYDSIFAGSEPEQQ